MLKRIRTVFGILVIFPNFWEEDFDFMRRLEERCERAFAEEAERIHNLKVQLDCLRASRR